MPATTAPAKGAGLFGRSEELEKLLGCFAGSDGGSLAHPSPGAPAVAAYDAEVMIDELLASTWTPMPSLPATRRPSTVSAVSGSRHTAFTQQTRAMNALHEVLAGSIARLKAHRQVVGERIAKLEAENQQAAAAYHEGLQSPEALLQHIGAQMEDLEERFTKVSSTAVLIGDRLAKLDGERSRVLETDELMEALVALNDPDAAAAASTKSSNRLVHTLRDPAQLHEAARVVKKMGVFSTELSSPAISRAVSEIERLSQKIETDLLEEFSVAQDKASVPGMRRCAESLIEYNDKEKVADRYVWNVMKDRIAKEGLRTPSASDDPVQDLEALFDTILAICREQFVVIEQVFPPTAGNSTRELLVERLFNDPAFGIFSYLDLFLTTSAASAVISAQQPPSAEFSLGSPTGGSTFPSKSQGSEDYVSMLCTAYEKTCALTAAIEEIDLPHVGADKITSGSNSSAHAGHIPVTGDSNSNQLERDEVDHERMHTFLSLQLHSLFGSHRQKYFRTELELLQSKCRDIIADVRFPQQLTTRQKAAAAKSNKSSAAQAAAATAQASSSPSASSTQLVSVTASSTNLERDIAVANPNMSLMYSEALRAIAENTTLPEKYALATTNAIARCDIVLKDSEMRSELITKMFATFTQAYGDEYLCKLATMAIEMLQEPYVSQDSARQYFELIEHLLHRIDFLDDQFDTIVAPALDDSPTQLTICYESKRKQLDKLEQSIARGLRQVFVVVEKDVSAILVANQDKADFVGSEANMSLSCSRACKKCADYLQPLITTITTVLLDENRDRFLVALCSLFKDLYLQHLQRFRFDPDGACMVLRDVNAFRELFRVFRHPSIDDTFDILHEVANVFALPPENLGGFVRDGKLASLGKQALLELIKRRVDYKANADKIALT